MRIMSESLVLECCQWRTLEELDNYLVHACLHYQRFGQDTEHAQEFHSVKIYHPYRADKSLCIGIHALGSGLSPCVLPLVSESKVVIGYNFEVCGVAIERREIDFRKELDSLFYDFVPVRIPKQILVQHEIGLVMMSTSGEIIWSFSKDVITNLQINDDAVHIDFMDSAPVSLSLKSGKKIQ